MNANRAIPAVPRGAWRTRVWKNRMMYLMLLIPLAMLILFKYVPMYGVQIAFRNFNFADGISSPGKYIELEAMMNVIVLVSNCPQLNNPCNGYDPTPVKMIIWDE